MEPSQQIRIVWKLHSLIGLGWDMWHQSFSEILPLRLLFVALQVNHCTRSPTLLFVRFPTSTFNSPVYPSRCLICQNLCSRTLTTRYYFLHTIPCPYSLHLIGWLCWFFSGFNEDKFLYWITACVVLFEFQWHWDKSDSVNMLQELHYPPLCRI
jgi:hypothetical protein